MTEMKKNPNSYSGGGEGGGVVIVVELRVLRLSISFSHSFLNQCIHK